MCRPPGKHLIENNVPFISLSQQVSLPFWGCSFVEKFKAAVPVEVGGYILEVWNYDPVLFAWDGQVDDISLLLSLESDPDERIQMGPDEIREKHELPVKYEE